MVHRAPLGELAVNSPTVPDPQQGEALYKDRVCQICDITLIFGRRGGSLPVPSPPPLRGPCFQSQR